LKEIGQYRLAVGPFFPIWGILTFSAWGLSEKKDPNPEDFLVWIHWQSDADFQHSLNIVHNKFKNKLCGNARSCF
jgi:hypothetical protein